MHKVEHEVANKRFLIQDNGDTAAVMTYVISSPELYIIDHTLVENAYRGQGLGDELIKAMVEYARKTGLRFYHYVLLPRDVSSVSLNMQMFSINNTTIHS
ncbi:GNAT family N-acetyltransferase [Paenibacillus amylolyticus]|nr:GNAT family N-acetyltransferase [Paenibacillus amylolyticus]WFR61099.1 GNAT family N-acetyltransferase [Paenibacillus amylolyticus]